MESFPLKLQQCRKIHNLGILPIAVLGGLELALFRAGTSFKGDTNQMLREHSKTVENYQQILRGIGQELEALHAQVFDLEKNDNQYVVYVQDMKSKNEYASKPNNFKNALATIWNKLKSRCSTQTTQGKPSFASQLLELQFSRDEIDRLKYKRQELRSTSASSPDAQSISQLLRAAGAYLDRKETHLLRLSWHDASMTICHRDRSGAELKEKFTSLNLYDLWVHQYKKRKSQYVLKKTH